MRVTLRAARVNANLTQEAAAKALQVTKNTIIAWETGRSMPTVDKIEGICVLYGATYDDIVWRQQ